MPEQKPLKFLFIINPIAGGKNKDEWETAIHEYFHDTSHTIDFHILTGENDETAVKKSIDDKKPDRAVAVGGDGTVTMVAKLIRNTPIALGILPAGSANGMAKELEIPATVKEALDISVTGISTRIDMIEINDEICLHLSDIGLNAQLIKYFEEGKLRGKAGYAKVLLKVLWNKQMMEVIIGSKEKEIRRKAFMVVLANASKYGFGAVINPESKLDDGFFEVIVIRRLALSELLKMIFKPQPFNPKKIEVFHARAVSIETIKRAHFQVDGEYLGKVKKIKGTILEKSLSILLPPDK
ncbi:MAG TPA: diacylglycerol kinase family protein [Flavitalea sp.]|nr:diacylglycerol kinase family protein [Flavitalea sp.]